MSPLALAGTLALLAQFAPISALANPQDQAFLTTASQGTLMQLVLGDLAAQRAGSESIRDYAQQAAADYRTLRSRIERSAAAVDADPAFAPSRAQQALADELLDLINEEFDLRFAEVVANELDDLLQAFRAEAESGTDARMRALADEFVPVLERRRAAADLLQARIAAAD